MTTITTELAERMRKSIEARKAAEMDSTIAGRLARIEIYADTRDDLSLDNFLALLNALADKDKQIAVLKKAHTHDESAISVLNDRIAELEARPEQQPVAWKLVDSPAAAVTVTDNKKMADVWMKNGREVKPLVYASRECLETSSLPDIEASTLLKIINGEIRGSGSVSTNLARHLLQYVQSAPAVQPVVREPDLWLCRVTRSGEDLYSPCGKDYSRGRGYYTTPPAPAAQPVTVKLPGVGGVEPTTEKSIRDWADGWAAYREEAVKALTAQGITIAEGE